MQIKNFVLWVTLTASLAAVGLWGCSKSSEGPKQEITAAAKDATGAAVSQPAEDSPVVSDLKAKLQAKPNDPDILQHLGDAYFDAKRFNEAVTYYKRVLEFKPGEADIYNDLGLSVHYLGNSPEGLRYIEEGIKKNPYHQRIWLTKGFILAYGMGDLNGAKEAWEKARALNPESQVGKAAAEFLAQSNKK